MYVQEIIYDLCVITQKPEIIRNGFECKEIDVTGLMSDNCRKTKKSWIETFFSLPFDVLKSF